MLISYYLELVGMVQGCGDGVHGHDGVGDTGYVGGVGIAGQTQPCGIAGGVDFNRCHRPTCWHNSLELGLEELVHVWFHGPPSLPSSQVFHESR